MQRGGRLWKPQYTRVAVWVVGLLALVLIVSRQIHIASLLYQKIGWDVRATWEVAKEIKETGTLSDNGYLNMYPNNRALTMFMYAVQVFMGNATEQQTYWVLVVINILLLDTAFCMSFYLAKRFFGWLTAVLSTAAEVVLIGFSGWILVPYSDTLTMWIPLAVLCFYLAAKESRKIYCKVLSLAAIGFLSLWGYHLKPQCVIIFIALLLCCYRFVSSFEKGKRFLVPLGLIAGVGIGCFTFQFASTQVFSDSLVDGVSMPVSHFFMMGMSENPGFCMGGYDEDSVIYSANGGETTREKDAACKERIKMYWKGYGWRGYLRHLYQKAAGIIGDGSFFWLGEGTFYLEDYSYQEGNQEQQQLREIYNGGYGGYDGTKLRQFMTYENGLWFCVIGFMMVFALAYGRHSKNIQEKTIIALAAAGCLAFTMLFEGRSRYLINYIPFYCMLGAGGFEWLVRDAIPGAGRKLNTKACHLTKALPMKKHKEA
jgi:hypothetical protein